MKLKKIRVLTISGLMVAAIAWLGYPALSRAQVSVDPAFNPNNIIADRDMMDYNSMSLSDIQNFLQSKGSFLTNYATLDSNGQIKSAAEIIYNATHNNYDCDGVLLSTNPTLNEKNLNCQHITTISPKVILVLLQKEQGLIEKTSPEPRNLDWATGYGCPDNWVCNPYYKGFGKQVNSAALQFLAYMNNPNYYGFQANRTYQIHNTPKPYCENSNRTMTVTPQNRATAALYDYTPHVFNGNYNFYKLWRRYFSIDTNIIYPNGTIIKAQNDPRIWLIENGQKRLFDNWSAFTSRFSPQQIVTVPSDILNNYPTGTEIKFANYSVVQTPNKQIYLLADETKRPFISTAVFKKLGYNPGELKQASADDLSAYATGTSITATSTYVTGALFQEKQSKNIYEVKDGTKALVDPVLLPIKFPYQKLTPTTWNKLAKYATTSPILLDNGALVKTTSYPTVYLISDGKKRPFANESIFKKLGYNDANVIAVSSQFLYNYDMGNPIQ